jgi:uncharacterized protein (DUF305 family)
MNNKSLLIGVLIGFVIGIVVAPWSTGARWGMRGMMEGRDKDDLYEDRSSFVDSNFIEQMIPHHEGAIEMAELALEKSQRPEILALAKDIIKAQEAEIVDMKEWYKDWYGKDVSTTTSVHMMGGHMMGGSMHMNSMSGDLETLKNAKDFDLEFIRQMIPHHEMAVMMAQMLQGSTDRGEMKTLAKNIITSQTKEIEMMRGWLQDWYNR